MRPLSLRVRVSLYLGIALAAAMTLFTLLILQHRQEDMQQMAAQHALHLADVIVASTRHTMQVNKRDIADKIISDKVCVSTSAPAAPRRSASRLSLVLLNSHLIVM